MITTGNNGRLGNQIIRNLAVSLLAKKHNLKVDYYNKALIESLGITLFSGNNTHKDIQLLTDSNYFEMYNSDNVNCDLWPNENFFQTKEITRYLHRYLHSEDVKSNVISKNPFKERYQANNDLFVHLRLDDVQQFNPGVDYYMNTINQVKFDQMYISTDEPTHNTVQKLLEAYPSAILIDHDEIRTFQFGSTCRHIILSHGSFSAVIGYLAFFSDVYYPEYETGKIWYGDMFSIDNWIKMNVKG